MNQDLIETNSINKLLDTNVYYIHIIFMRDYKVRLRI